MKSLVYTAPVIVAYMRAMLENEISSCDAYLKGKVDFTIRQSLAFRYPASCFGTSCFLKGEAYPHFLSLSLSGFSLFFALA